MEKASFENVKELMENNNKEKLRELESELKIHFNEIERLSSACLSNFLSKGEIKRDIYAGSFIPSRLGFKKDKIYTPLW